ncbi:MAG: polysaccharide deacetylase family protein, partial [Flavobacterium sp.]|nr:polysaccharide deacetylase family protein [Flavobacterium sp.]
MKPYWIKTHSIIKRLLPNYVWDIPNYENKVYLTFDDGPTPEITNWVLSQLKAYNAKGTFFCIGKNIMQNPEIYQNIISNGHSVGNHTFNHLNGWKTNNEIYIKNALQLRNLQPITHNIQLFRPPYGKIKPSQAGELKKNGYQIIMWDILSADFDFSISPEKCLDNVLKNLKSGSIIVFHDSEKAFKNLEYVLPKTLEYLKV